MSDTFTTKAKLDSTTIRGWLVLIVPFILTLLRMFGVDIPDNLNDELINNIMSIVEGITYLVGLIMVYVGRVNATKFLKGDNFFGGWTK